MTWNNAYDRFLSLSAWFSTFLYAAPAALLVLAFDYFDATKPYIIPALLIYLIGAIAHLLAYGLQAVCVQLKVCTDYQVEQSAPESKGRRGMHESQSTATGPA